MRKHHGWKHDKIVRLSRKLLNPEYLFKEGGAGGVDLKGKETGVEVKTFPSTWEKKIKEYRRKGGYKKMILILEMPDCVDDIFAYKQGEIAKEAKHLTSKLAGWLNGYTKLLLNQIAEEDLETGE